MRRLARVLPIVVVAFALLGGAARADTVHGYAGPGEWFSPGEGHGSSYDSLCGRWVDNNFAKPSNGRMRSPASWLIRRPRKVRGS